VEIAYGEVEQSALRLWCMGGCWINCGGSKKHFGAAGFIRDRKASTYDTHIHCDNET
jgi:hypothetical protein